MPVPATCAVYNPDVSCIVVSIYATPLLNTHTCASPVQCGGSRDSAPFLREDSKRWTIGFQLVSNLKIGFSNVGSVVEFLLTLKRKSLKALVLTILRPNCLKATIYFLSRLNIVW